ncbi:MAG: hypothetical protein QG635_647 [Bacteroidota bacterium]|nr:hypothetical protein [Bacteroidota bacterium]
MSLLTKYQDSLDPKMIAYRQAVYSGSFYPSDPDSLRSVINDYLSSKDERIIEGDILAIVSPHAGYPYSGWVAGKVYSELIGRKYDAIIIIAPSHSKLFNGASVYSGDGYSTPLGKCEVDKELANAIAKKNKTVYLSLDGHDWKTNETEHSLEVQLPFLQIVLPDVPIVPIVMGTQDFQTIDDLMKAIVSSIKESGRKVLIVASSDLSHYHDNKTSRQMDSALIGAFDRFDYFKMSVQCQNRRWEACGYGPIITAMTVGEQLGATKAKSIFYANSSDSPYTKTSKDRVVGYFCGAIINTGSENSIDLPILSDEDKSKLLKAARTGILNAVKGNKTKKDDKIPENLAVEYPTFVTIKKHGDLRGCMGHTFASQPLLWEVEETGRLASESDSRFSPIKESELPELEIEVTILSRYKRVLDINEIEIGADGVYLRVGYNTGLFLPQVATENNWDRKTYLEYLGLKAGLDRNAYKNSNAQLYKYQAVILK